MADDEPLQEEGENKREGEKKNVRNRYGNKHKRHFANILLCWNPSFSNSILTERGEKSKLLVSNPMKKGIHT